MHSLKFTQLFADICVNGESGLLRLDSLGECFFHSYFIVSHKKRIVNTFLSKIFNKVLLNILCNLHYSVKEYSEV